MNYTTERLAAIFNLWVKKYSEDPESFREVLDSEGKPFEDYGIESAVYFEKLNAELEAEKGA